MEIVSKKVHYQVDMEKVSRELKEMELLACRLRLISDLVDNVCFWFPASNKFIDIPILWYKW